MRFRFWLVALAAMATAVFAAPVQAACTLSRVAELPVTMHNLRPTVQVKVNGQDATFFIDTGAFFSTVTPSAAARFGMHTRALPPYITVTGVGGSADVLLTTADKFTIAGSDIPRIDFLVAEKGFGGGEAGLIGQNILGIFDMEYDLANGAVRIFDPKGCGRADLAYWTSSPNIIPIEQASSLSRVSTGWATVNGVRAMVLFDTGSPRSMISLQTAARAGAAPADAGVTSDGYTSGLGLRSYLRTWVAPFDDIKVGDEEIKHTKIMIGDMKLNGDADMLLGADFFLSHRVLVSNSQHKLYFTYNGGAVFNLEAPPPPATAVAPGAQASAQPTADKAADYSDAPTDAVSFERRSAAYANRRDYKAAVVDLTHAITLDPANAQFVYERAVAELYDGDSAAGEADLDRALALKPNEPKFLLFRAELHIRAGEKARARIDLDVVDHAIPADGDERLRLSQDYQSLTLEDEALGQLDAWLAAHPKDDQTSMAMNDRCWLRALSGKDLDKALADCNAALKLLPGDPKILDSRGMVRLRRGDLTGAMADYRAALRLLPDSPWSLYGRGLAELRSGKTAEGEADLKAAEAIWPKITEEAKSHGLTP